jgi:hypothetical protein
VTQYTYGLTRLLGHGHAFSEVVTVPSPAAGAGFTYTNTGSQWQLIDSIAFRIVTDGNAANRQVKLVYANAEGVALATLPTASVQTATLTWDYTWSTDFDTFNTVVALAVTSPLLNIFLQPGFQIVVSVGAVQAGDQISRIKLYTEQFVTGPQGYLLGVVDGDDPRLHSSPRPSLLAD